MPKGSIWQEKLSVLEAPLGVEAGCSVPSLSSDYIELSRAQFMASDTIKTDNTSAGSKGMPGHGPMQNASDSSSAYSACWAMNMTVATCLQVPFSRSLSMLY